MSLNGSIKAKNSILIIDDEKNTREIFVEILKRNDYQKVEGIGTGGEAIKILMSKKVDVAIIDLKLPDIHGMDLISKLRSLSPDTEFIVVTGYGSLDSAIKAIQFEVGGYLEKPISSDKLLRTLDEVLTKHELKLENQKFIKDLDIANKEILFLNDLLVNNVDDLNQSLLLTMVQIEKLNPTNEQKKVLLLFQEAIRKNARLTRNIKKLQAIDKKVTVDKLDLDISKIFINVINRLRSDYSEKNFEVIGDFSKPNVVVADNDLNHLLLELLLISILSDPNPKIKITIDFSEAIKNNIKYLKMNVKAFQMKYIFDQINIKHPTELKVAVSEQSFQDLGPFIINSLLKFYNGFVDLPEKENRNLIDIYIPTRK